MQRFEAVFQRERVTSVTRALADRGFNGISVKPARSSEGFFGLAAVAVEYDDAGECDSDAVKLELTVDDQLSLEVFRVIARTAGAGKISRFPMA